MPRAEFDPSRRRFLGIAGGLGAGFALNGCSWVFPEGNSDPTRTSEVYTPLSREVVVANGFQFLTPDREPVIAPWGITTPALITSERQPHTVEAHGIITPRPDVRNRLLGQTGTVQSGLNEVTSALVEGQEKVISQVHGGVWVYIPSTEVSVAVRTEGNTPLEYSMQATADNAGYLLKISGERAVVDRAQTGEIASNDGTPFPTPDAGIVVNSLIAVLPK